MDEIAVHTVSGSSEEDVAYRTLAKFKDSIRTDSDDSARGRRLADRGTDDKQELKRRKGDKQHHQRIFNRQAALPAPFQAMEVVN